MAVPVTSPVRPVTSLLKPMTVSRTRKPATEPAATRQVPSSGPDGAAASFGSTSGAGPA